MRTVTELGCIVDNCAWTYVEPDPAQHIDQRAHRLTIEDLVEQALKAQAWETEAAVRDHLASHNVADWARTIARLRGIERRAQIVERAPIPPMDSDTARYILDPVLAAGVAEREG